ncbi:HEPN domain-containing protein [Mucilaginibacter sp.]|uniref:HEPN domain-containing protein n=1 Tax=Mucilaginibacter sp. TaxID=1882438 RepID=UPI0025FFA9C4|nr:HEPN domain-containing protein [Mucilaginibacter sp.]
MERKHINLSPFQCRELEEIITPLVSQYQTEYILCFGCLNDTKSAASCFIEEIKQSNTHYFLLMVTTEPTRIEHEVQDYVNNHFEQAAITIIAHGLETVTNAVSQGNRFFNVVCREGMQLYTASGLRLNLGYPNLNPATTLATAEKHFYHRYQMALGFMEAPGDCFEKAYYDNTVFMLHQAVEQACITMIGVFMAYRSDKHNLTRLLNLCLCFSGEPAAIFPRKTGEDQRLFQLLLKSYSEARYRDEYNVSSQDADILCTQVRALITLTEELCIDQINDLRTAVSHIPKQN